MSAVLAYGGHMKDLKQQVEEAEQELATALLERAEQLRPYLKVLHRDYTYTGVSGTRYKIEFQKPNPDHGPTQTLVGEGVIGSLNRVIVPLRDTRHFQPYGHDYIETAAERLSRYITGRIPGFAGYEILGDFL